MPVSVLGWVLKFNSASGKHLIRDILVSITNLVSCFLISPFILSTFPELWGCHGVWNSHLTPSGSKASFTVLEIK